MAQVGKIKVIYITYPDRLTRCGFCYFVKFFESLGVKLISVNRKEYREPEKELVGDI